MKEPNIQELEIIHKELLFSLTLPDAVLSPQAPGFMRSLDMTFARQLLGSDRPWGKEDAFDERTRIIDEVLCASREAKRLFLFSEIDMLRNVRESAKDFVHKGPFEIMEALFPVRIRDHVVHVIRSGKFRETPFSGEDLKEIAFLSGVPVKKVEEAAATLPVLPQAQRETSFALYRKYRDAVTHAMEEHIRVVDLTEQQIGAERMISLGTLAEGMAHHINNLLSIILGYASHVTDRATLAPDAAEALRKAAEAAQRGRRFTEEILAVAGSLDEQDIVCSVHERINGVLTLLQGRIAPKIKLELGLAAKCDLVLSPPAVLHQIIFNLLTNALDSMPTGGLLSILTSNHKAEGSADNQEFLRIEVVDSSGKMPRKSTRRLASTSTSPGLPAGENIGPKLTSVFGLVGRLEGTVAMTSDPGMVTRVEVVIPVTEPAAAEAPHRKVKRRLAPSRIWVADDDDVIREMCKRVLVEEGHTVEELNSGKALNDLVGQTAPKPDLIIYDFSMPDYSGLEICNKLREDGLRIPVLLISGFKPDQPEIARTLKLRKTFFLQKPFSFRDMSDMVTVALGETLIEE